MVFFTFCYCKECCSENWCTNVWVPIFNIFECLSRDGIAWSSINSITFGGTAKLFFTVMSPFYISTKVPVSLQCLLLFIYFYYSHSSISFTCSIRCEMVSHCEFLFCVWGVCVCVCMCLRFIFGCLGLCCCARALSSCCKWELLFVFGVPASQCSDFSCCRAWALGTWASVALLLEAC